MKITFPQDIQILIVELHIIDQFLLKGLTKIYLSKMSRFIIVFILCLILNSYYIYAIVNFSNIQFLFLIKFKFSARLFFPILEL